MSSKKTCALLLFSGGLDSIIAAKVLQNAGCEVTALTFETPFFNAKKARESAKSLGIEIIVRDISAVHFKLLRDPPHGFGKNLNPCIDCHGLMFRLAGEIAGLDSKLENSSKLNFQIIASGEVLGQRPFSQNKQALGIVEKIAGVEILRPLSAKNLPETFYERENLISREQLLDLSGRTRKPQIALAAEWGIEYFPAPAGGCLLTDPAYSARLKKLLERDSGTDFNEAELLKVGRFFLVGERSFVMIGRDEAENEQLQSLAKSQMLRRGVSALIKMQDFAGPTALLVLKKPDDFEEIFPKITEKIKNYGKDSKNYEGEIEWNVERKT